MSSIIPGYNYDIFISYRQKDNKGDKWVSEFVEALKTELESTFKEEISVYFDINPHDGLLETHDVDASLKEKLKCLVFIPIISRTYCDPKSFAWGHEFKVFIEQASQDKFGLKVKLPNGNVANRVLPVRIHDLDNDDIKLCESLIGGFLRGVEFIYQESGVNRPLRGNEDRPNDNLNRTVYRNQINKVGNAVKEIISGLTTEPVAILEENARSRDSGKEVRSEISREVHKNPVKSGWIKILSGFLITAIVVMAVILVYPKIFKHDKLDNLRSSDGRISVAVMPFRNMTNDTIWNVWQDGIQINLITSLSSSEELKVKQLEPIDGLLKGKGITNYASITPSVASTISQKLDANIVIYGSINKAGSTLRLNAQLIDSKTEETLKSFQIEGIASENEIFQNIDSLSFLLRNYLLISKIENELRKETTNDFLLKRTTNSPEAYRYFIYGMNAFIKKLDMTSARNWYLRSLSVDSNFTLASFWILGTYYNQGLNDEAKKWCLRLYKKREQMPLMYQLLINDTYALLFETPYEGIKYLRQILEIDDQQPMISYLIGTRYYLVSQYEKAIPEFEKSFEIYKKWGVKPPWIYAYIQLGEAYHKTGHYIEENNLYKKAEQDFPDDLALIYRQAILSLTEKDNIVANRFIEKYISALKDNSASEAEIATNLGFIYWEADILAKAEECLREALTLEPDNPDRLNNLAWLLIDKDRNINEGLELFDKALILSPDNYEYLDAKGWGLYKQGRYQEALEILQKSWDLRREQAIYSHEPFLHLEAANKAVAGQKNN
jgi:tetratricopeptide (TPR) repeat protein